MMTGEKREPAGSHSMVSSSLIPTEAKQLSRFARLVGLRILASITLSGLTNTMVFGVVGQGRKD